MKKGVLLSIMLTLLAVCNITMAGESDIKEAIFAGGCFWCMQSDFRQLPGVVNVVLGYDGGTVKNPTYEAVSSGQTNYAESVKVFYNASQVDYKMLLDYFWYHVDPMAQDAQFCDHGHQYRSAIFYLNNQQKQDALASKMAIKKLFPKVYTEVAPSTHFYDAQAYYQDYAKKNPIQYKYSRWRCGRDAQLAKIWHGKKA